MFSFIFFISLILFSIFIHSLIIKFNLLSSLYSSSNFLPLSKDIFILLGNFSLSLINSSLKNKSLNFLSISNRSSSSLSFKVFLFLF